MAKLRIIDGEKMIDIVSIGCSLALPESESFIRPQTRTAAVIPNDAILEGK